MNPIEELIAKFRLLGQPSDAGDESQEWTYRKCADLLEAAIRPYRPAPGPPPEPGWYQYKCLHSVDDHILHFSDIDVESKVKREDQWAIQFDDIEWHARVMPPFGEVGE